MNKRTAILLIVVLVSGIVVAGHGEAMAAVEQNSTWGTVATSLGADLIHSDTSDSTSLPRLPDRIISDLLADCGQQPSCIRLVRHQTEIQGFTHSGHGAKSAARGSCELSQRGGQPRRAILGSLPGRLSLFSPPGLILRL
jgi:hypothetical protein